ncbi:receptor-like protein 53 [Salvia splendens]|uniref:receptor-like protein 53 n=1 Tax=Salvia splendens TaxID=180675 RepID=UPI001C27737B|nr:receptor-like protein 53 [Salvia splendens]
MTISSLSYLLLFSITLTTTSISVRVHGQCLEDQKAALLELKRGWKFDPSYSKKLVHWNETYDCCSWGGVDCNNVTGTVQGLYLSNESISGEIHTSSSIFSLGSLLFLELDNNSLRGAIPRRLFNLWSVTLSNNLFDNISQPESYASPPPPTGPFVIATNFSVPTVFLSLANNRLSGKIPTFFCEGLPTIQGLDLSFNNFSGSIPRCLLRNPYIRMLNLKANKLNGSIPDQFGNCALTTLDVSHNGLTGEIPKSIASCESLQVLNVGYNNLDGFFPCMLPPSLHVLVLHVNRFRGEVRCDMS